MRSSAAAPRRAQPVETSGWKRKGLLVGLSLVLAVVVVFAVGALMHALALNRDLQESFSQNRLETAQMQIQILERALELYRAEHGAYPTDKQGLAALESYFGGREPLDPWGYTYVYRQATAPKVISYGADGAPGGVGNDADVQAPEKP